jgi:hypothetical protein
VGGADLLGRVSPKAALTRRLIGDDLLQSLSVPRRKECCGAPESPEAGAEFANLGFARAHFDGHPINGERPFLVGLSRIIVG